MTLKIVHKEKKLTIEINTKKYKVKFEIKAKKEDISNLNIDKIKSSILQIISEHLE